MSASRMPTLAPSAASANARFTETVDLPTPPLPEATAIRFLTPVTSLAPFWALWDSILEETFTVTPDTPDKATTISRTIDASLSLKPAAGYPSAMSTVTAPSLTATFLMALAATRSFSRYGSTTWASAASTWDVLTDI